MSDATITPRVPAHSASSRAVPEVPVETAPTTPPHGLDLRGADTSMVLTEMRAEESRKHAHLDRIEGRVDALIMDVRGLMSAARTRDEALFALLGLPAAVQTIRDEQDAAKKRDEARDRRIEDIARRLGIVERAPREGSSPQLDRLTDIVLEDMDTEVRRRKVLLADEERARALRAANRARLWGIVWKSAAVLGPLLGAAVARSCGG